MKLNFDDYQGRKISVMLRGLNEKMESYAGVLKEVGEDFIKIDTNNKEFFLSEVIVRKDLVESIWVYR